MSKQEQNRAAKRILMAAAAGMKTLMTRAQAIADNTDTRLDSSRYIRAMELVEIFAERQEIALRAARNL